MCSLYLSLVWKLSQSVSHFQRKIGKLRRENCSTRVMGAKEVWNERARKKNKCFGNFMAHTAQSDTYNAPADASKISNFPKIERMTLFCVCNGWKQRRGSQMEIDDDNGCLNVKWMYLFTSVLPTPPPLHLPPPAPIKRYLHVKYLLLLCTLCIVEMQSKTSLSLSNGK